MSADALDEIDVSRGYWTHSEIATLYGCHKSWVQVLEARAIAKMRAAAEQEAAAAGMSVREWLIGEFD